MDFRNLVCRALVMFVVIGLFSVSALSQTRPRLSQPLSGPNEVSSLHQDSALVAKAVNTEARPAWEIQPKPLIELAPVGPTTSAPLKIQPPLMAAIGARLGAPYRWGATGPDRFDCSGFVWSIYQATGINFERVSARNLFARFPEPLEGEQYRFGTLVFFSGLTHVGVVADENGFYHASRRHGVVYQPFTDYWVKRIDGFRSVPLAEK